MLPQPGKTTWKLNSKGLKSRHLCLNALWWVWKSKCTEGAWLGNEERITMDLLWQAVGRRTENLTKYTFLKVLSLSALALLISPPKIGFCHNNLPDYEHPYSDNHCQKLSVFFIKSKQEWRTQSWFLSEPASPMPSIFSQALIFCKLWAQQAPSWLSEIFGKPLIFKAFSNYITNWIILVLMILSLHHLISRCYDKSRLIWS